MKPRSWIAIFLLVTLASYYFHLNSHHSTEKEASGPLVSATPTATPGATPISVPVTPPVSNPTQTTFKPSTRSKSRIEQFAAKPKDLFVHFEVINGYAVAYGDTLLGKPLNDFHDREGLAEVRPPRFWERGEVPYAIKED